MYLVGDVDREVAVALEEDCRSRGRDRVEPVALDADQGLGRRHGQVDLGQRAIVLVAATGVLIEFFDKLGNGPSAVADHDRGVTPHSRHQPVAHHQETVFGAAGVPLDQHAIALDQGNGEGRFDLLPGVQVGEDAPAVVAVERLDDDRKADFPGSRPGVGRPRDQSPLGHRHAGRSQQSLGQFLVLGDVFADDVGILGLGGEDSPLRGAVAQLDETSGVQPENGDVAGLRRPDDRAGARAEANPVGQVPHFWISAAASYVRSSMAAWHRSRPSVAQDRASSSSSYSMTSR